MHFFSVSKFNNAFTILQNIERLKSFYKKFNYSLVIPSQDKDKFEKIFKSKSFCQLKLIPETEIISLEEFRSIYELIVNENQFNIKKCQISANLGWYYQQVLKIAFAIENGSTNDLVMIDADTILIRKLDFFHKNNSIIYLTPYERNIPYMKISELIFNIKFINWYSSTSQLFSTTTTEIEFLRKSLINFQIKERGESIANWISRIVLKSVLMEFNDLNGSFFSEQDLISTSNQLNGSNNLQMISFFRFNLKNKLTSNQILIAKLFGISHITYEARLINESTENANYIQFFIILFHNLYLNYKNKIIKNFKKQRIIKIY